MFGKGKRESSNNVGLGSFYVGIMRQSRSVEVEAMHAPHVGPHLPALYGAPTLLTAAIYAARADECEALCRSVLAVSKGIPDDHVEKHLRSSLPLGVRTDGVHSHNDFAFTGTISQISIGKEVKILGRWEPSEGIDDASAWLTVAGLWLATRGTFEDREAAVIDHTMDALAQAYLDGTVAGDNLEAAAFMPHLCVQHAFGLADITMATRRGMADWDE